MVYGLYIYKYREIVYKKRKIIMYIISKLFHQQKIPKWTLSFLSNFDNVVNNILRIYSLYATKSFFNPFFVNLIVY